jgi:TonB family protein
MKLLNGAVILTLLCIARGSALHSQTADDRSAAAKTIEKTLKNQTVTIRGFYEGSRLRYDAAGNPIGEPKSGPWVLDARVIIRKVELSKQALLLRADRLGGVFDFDKQDLVFGPTGQHVTFEIAWPDDSSAVSTALQQVFLRSDEPLLDKLPKEWQRQLMRPGECNAENVCRVAKGVIQPPRAVYAPDPEYSEEARRARLQGKVILWVLVGDTGKVVDCGILRSLGMGLDQQALTSIRQWRFDPAMRGGKPVAVQINVEMSFELR